MYASFARNSPAPVGADLLSLSWKGDARRGWLVAGNSRKTVGVTYTQLTDEDEFECDLFESTAEQSEISLEKQANRRNFNFREHAHEVRRCYALGEHPRNRVSRPNYYPSLRLSNACECATRVRLKCILPRTIWPAVGSADEFRSAHMM